jgi:hypothetical protein
MNVNDELGRMLQAGTMVHSKVISQHLLEGPEENHKKTVRIASSRDKN